MKHLLCLAMLLLASACGSSLPALSDLPQVPSPPFDEDAQARSERDHRNEELRTMYDRCEDKRIALQRDVDDAKDGNAVAATAATGALIAGQAASNTDNIQNAPEPDAIRTPPASGQSVSSGASRGAKGAMKNINAMLEDLSGFLIANPNLQDWSEEEVARYDSLMANLRSACR